MKSVKTVFSIENNHSAFEQFDLNIKEIEAFVPKIVNKLLSIEEVYSNTCFSELNFDTLNFDIMFVDDKEIQKINLNYRQKDVSTDVITFALFADDQTKFVLDGEINLGEIIVSIDTAYKQAQESLKKEIFTLITHGTLHLFGFDHLTNEDYNFVVDIQNRVLEVL